MFTDDDIIAIYRQYDCGDVRDARSAAHAYHDHGIDPARVRRVVQRHTNQAIALMVAMTVLGCLAIVALHRYLFA